MVERKKSKNSNRKSEREKQNQKRRKGLKIMGKIKIAGILKGLFSV
jgi:hypothetical protein